MWNANMDVSADDVCANSAIRVKPSNDRQGKLKMEGR